MNVQRLFVGELVTNCYLISGETEVTVIDPGGNPEKIQNACNGKPITNILLTHGHLDHTFALGDLCDRWHPRVYLHRGDEDFLNRDELRAPVGTGTAKPLRYDLTVTDWTEDGQMIPIAGGLSVRVMHTPGHTPGSVCYYIPEEKTLFSGDTLFRGGEGRTDFPRSCFAEIKQSLRKLTALPADISVLPGHGFSTKIGNETWMAEN